MSPTIQSARRVGAVQGAKVAPSTASELPNGGFGAALERLLDGPAQTAQATATGSTIEPSDDGAKVGTLRFSRHAASRMQSRDMQVSDEELTRLEGAVDQLAQRGGKESLVLLGERAYIVGVPKRTVITVMPRAEALGTVFTNIDSTYVA